MRVPSAPSYRLHSGKRIAECKGVYREVESEGSGRRTSGLVNKNRFVLYADDCTILCKSKWPTERTCGVHCGIPNREGGFARDVHFNLRILFWYSAEDRLRLGVSVD